MEFGADLQYQPLRALGNVRISDSGDIYDLLHVADVVVGVSSTVLFEAVGLDRPVFVYATPSAELYNSRDCGVWFSSVNELERVLDLPMQLCQESDIG
jgi:CDP-glycerol glycerophosphotransferase (TagB/SpsB family)